MIFCDNKINDEKRCGKETAAQLKLEKGKEPEDCDVLCADCGKVITNVNKFMKRNLYFAKQLQQTSQPGEAFALKCEHCNNSRRPEIKDKKIICQVCQKEMNQISPFYKNLLFSQSSSGR
jgi:hypothetical protein